MNKEQILRQLTVDKNCFNITCANCPIIRKCFDSGDRQKIELGARLPDSIVKVANVELDAYLNEVIEEFLCE